MRHELKYVRWALWVTAGLFGAIAAYETLLFLLWDTSGMGGFRVMLTLLACTAGAATTILGGLFVKSSEIKLSGLPDNHETWDTEARALFKAERRFLLILIAVLGTVIIGVSLGLTQILG